MLNLRTEDKQTEQCQEGNMHTFPPELLSVRLEGTLVSERGEAEAEHRRQDTQRSVYNRSEERDRDRVKDLTV